MAGRCFGPHLGRSLCHLFSPRADEAYASAMSFMVGNRLAAILAATIEFAVLPRIATSPEIQHSDGPLS